MAGTVPIVIELDENAPIKSLAQLHRIPGLAHIHFNFAAFDNPKEARREMLGLPPPAKRNGKNGKTHPIDGFSPSQEILRLLEERGGPMTRTQIKEAGGVNGARMLTNITSMKKAGAIKKVGPGTYDLPDRKPPTATTRAAVAGKKTGVDIIVGLLAQKKKGETASRKDFGEAFVMSGKSKASVGDAVAKAIAAGKIKSPARDTFELV